MPTASSQNSNVLPSLLGEVGLLVCRITQLTPFSGYAGGKSQTEKKKLRDVFKKGDVYFNSGDLLMIDQDNFVYFHDRVGDTFRWVSLNYGETCTIWRTPKLQSHSTLVTGLHFLLSLYHVNSIFCIPRKKRE